MIVVLLVGVIVVLEQSSFGKLSVSVVKYYLIELKFCQ